MEINDRLTYARKAQRLTQSEFALRLKRTGSWLSDLERGRFPISDEVFEKIEREFNISRQWLETGEGEILIKGVNPPTVQLPPHNKDVKAFQIDGKRPVTIIITNTVTITVGGDE